MSQTSLCSQIAKKRQMKVTTRVITSNRARSQSWMMESQSSEDSSDMRGRSSSSSLGL